MSNMVAFFKNNNNDNKRTVTLKSCYLEMICFCDLSIKLSNKCVNFITRN